MKIGIIGAMSSEVDGVKAEMEAVSVNIISGIEFATGRINGVETIVAQAGVGKVNAAICAQTMVLIYKPNAIINIGVAGGYNNLSIGDVVIADSVVQHDMDTSSLGELGEPKGFINGIDLIHIPTDKKLSEKLLEAARNEDVVCCSGVIASGDQFINSTKRAQQLHDDFNAIAFEMEGASIGHVCFQNKIPFAVLRSISDNGDDSSNIDFPAFVKAAADIAISIILSFLRSNIRL